jgi:hypothetical protein
LGDGFFLVRKCCIEKFGFAPDMYPSRKECRAMIFRLFARLFALCTVLASASLLAQSQTQTIDGWQMQDSANVVVPASLVSTNSFDPQGWYAATVPGTVLTTLVNDGVYPEPLYGENMRAIPESLNKTSYWYRAQFGDKRERVQRAKRLLVPLPELSALASMFGDIPALVSQKMPNPSLITSDLKLLSALFELGEFTYDSLGANHLLEVSKFALASLVHETTGQYLDRLTYRKYKQRFHLTQGMLQVAIDSIGT